MPLHLTPRQASSLPIDLAGLTPDAIRDKRLAEIERQPVAFGNRSVPLAELFAIRGDPADGAIEIDGDAAHVHSLGAGMTSGAIRVAGNVGRHAGAEMCGGRLRIEGDAGDWLGRAMRGGRIAIGGRAGDFAGGASAGWRRGMTGGEIFISGAAGAEIGRAMRRGLIVVGGSAGDSLGLNLLAGTILAFGPCGENPGVGMRRGTIGLFAGPVRLPLSFRRANRWQPQFMRLLLDYLSRAGVAAAESYLDACYVAHHGDLLALGKGEILVREH